MSVTLRAATTSTLQLEKSPDSQSAWWVQLDTPLTGSWLVEMLEVLDSRAIPLGALVILWDRKGIAQQRHPTQWDRPRAYC